MRGDNVVDARGGADGDGDVVLTKCGETFLGQCKESPTIKIGANVVRELCGILAARGATGLFVVTSGEFTPDA